MLLFPACVTKTQTMKPWHLSVFCTTEKGPTVLAKPPKSKDERTLLSKVKGKIAFVKKTWLWMATDIRHMEFTLHSANRMEHIGGGGQVKLSSLRRMWSVCFSLTELISPPPMISRHLGELSSLLIKLLSKDCYLCSWSTLPPKWKIELAFFCF